MTIVFYISGHGFGHASRTVEVMSALMDRQPDVEVIVRSQVAPWLFARTARPGIRLEPVVCDTGVAQIDSLHLDADQTIARARAFMNDFPARVATEVARLRALGASLVVADLPPLGIAAAAAAGIPSVAYGNFTWDWIYAGYEGGQDLADAVGEIYRDTTRALRLPMWGGFGTIGDVLDLPFVARRSSRDPEEVRRALGFSPTERLVLVSFGGYGLRLDGRALAAVDVVVSKPGYGIISECLANGTALLYTSRGHFAEYDVLVSAMPRFLRCAFFGHADLFAGHWGRHLDAILDQPAPPDRPATNGAEIAAARLLEMI